MTSPHQRFSVSSLRPKLMFEVAAEMVGRSDWPYRNARITMRDQGGEHDAVHTLMGTQDPAAIADVVRGEVAIAMLNPSAMLTLAARGTGPFAEPQPIAPIAVIPSDDQFAFAVTESSRIESLEQIAKDKPKLRVSIRGAHDPSTAMLGNEVLKAYGFTLDDIERWGGRVSYDQPLPSHPSRIGKVESGELDAIFDEATSTWVDRAAAMGMRFLLVDGKHMSSLTVMGFRPNKLSRAQFPHLPDDVPAIDFSGWPIYCHTRADDALVTAFCESLEARKSVIQWSDDGSQLPLARMVRDAPDAPLDIPLHPAAARVWQSFGYL